MDKFLNSSFFSAIIGGVIASVIAPFLTKKLELSKKRDEIIQMEKINLYKELHSLLDKIFIFDDLPYSKENWNNLTNTEKENIYKNLGIEKVSNEYNDYIVRINAKLANSLSENINYYDKRRRENSLFLSEKFMLKSEEIYELWNIFVQHLIKKREFPPKNIQDKLKLKIEESQNILRKELNISF